MTVPLDHPYDCRPLRVYVALTNHCNRACPWCSTCSSPSGSTFLTKDAFVKALPASGLFELQLEGGEPTIHPLFKEFVGMALAHPRLSRLVLCTNGTTLPREYERLRKWIDDFGDKFTLKLSLNHYLLEHDSALPALAVMLKEIFDSGNPERLLVINVRLRKGYADDDESVRRLVEEKGLPHNSNIFFLQRYGFASEEEQWEEPFLAGTNFVMVNPDGRTFGTDLVERSKAMGDLP